MFQYAAGRALANRLGTQLKLNISDFEHSDLRRYELKYFKIHESIASYKEIFQLKYDHERFIDRIFRKLQGRQVPLSCRVYDEPHFHFDPCFDKLQNETFLVGYFQSEKYFSAISGSIRQEFQPKALLQGEVKTIAEKIKSCNAVGIHFRLGDYLSNPISNNYHGICSMDYYQEAIARISRQCSHPIFFLFSDDMEWVRQNFRIKRPVFFVEHHCYDKASEDIRLMSLCKHNIIANSTFSWWGAWLNANPCKLVIAPHRWFNINSIDTSDLIASSWIRL